MSLRRSLTLPLVTFYGLGTIVGAGIYVLVGEVARTAGTLMPVSFALAAGIATLTGLTYAELAARFPNAAGAVLYVDEAFGWPTLSRVVGLLVLLTGIVSAATISRGFVGYLGVYWRPEPTVAIIALCLVMGTIASMGIRESAWAVTLITLLEVVGLLAAAGFALASPPISTQPPGLPPWGPGPVFTGAFLAFYAFIGFEDMVNLAEEVQDPRRTVPRAIFLSLAGAGLLYVGVALVAARNIDLIALGSSDSPLALMVGDRPAAMRLIGAIGVVAITNGALTQIIMASRMLYGMAQRGLLPSSFGHVDPRTQTPVRNTWLVVGTILAFALWLPVVTLAKITSAIMLVIFTMVHTALIRLDRSADSPSRLGVPGWVPRLGVLANFCLLAYPLIAGGE